MPVQVIMPKLTYEMLEGRVLEWLAAEGDEVAAGQTLFVVETDKASVEVPADEPGVLLKIITPVGETVPVSTVVAWIGRRGEAVPDTVPPMGLPAAAPLADTPARPAGTPTLATGPARIGSEADVPASPIARRLARELGVDLSDVQAASGQPRVREADVQAFAEAQRVAQAVGPAAPPAAVLASRPEPAYELVHPTPLQRAMAQHMTQAAAIPQMAAAVDLDTSELERVRGELAPTWQTRFGYRPSYTHLFAVLVARVLVSQRALNASWTEAGIRFFSDVNLGVAMATERGLVVPVVRDAARGSLEGVAAEIVRLQRAAEANRLPPQDLEGGTFTMTNVGMLGISLSVPLLNPPQSGILAIGARREQVVLVDGQVVARPVLTVTLVADHRVADGAAVAGFLKSLKQLAEQPRATLGCGE